MANALLHNLHTPLRGVQLCVRAASTDSEASMSEKAPPKYLADVLRVTANLKPGTLQHVEVRHDSWCALLNGRGPCICHPEVVLLGESH
jgi:hypothetical protein